MDVVVGAVAEVGWEDPGAWEGGVGETSRLLIACGEEVGRLVTAVQRMSLLEVLTLEARSRWYFEIRRWREDGVGPDLTAGSGVQGRKREMHALRIAWERDLIYILKMSLANRTDFGCERSLYSFLHLRMLSI